VVRDPSQPQETLLLQGFMGASSQPDYTRVYSDLSLSSYVDVANNDIIHIEPLPKEQSPMGGAYIWVKKETDVLPATGTGTLGAKAKFLEGPIATETTSAPKPAPDLPKTIPIVACHPTIVVAACAPSAVLANCPTRIIAQCPPVRTAVACAPSVFELCVTMTGPCVAGTGLACRLPDPTIGQQTQQVPEVQQQFGAAAVVLQPPTGNCPRSSFLSCQPQSATCPTQHCPTERICPDVQVQPTVAAACNATVAASVCQCPSIPLLSCPTNAVACHQAAQPVGGVQAAAAVPALLPSTQNLTECGQPVTTALCHPSALCPTPHHMCPSVAGFQCPSVAGFQCPSVAGFQCPSVAGFHCAPSVNGFECPSVEGFRCPPSQQLICPTPNPLHCPRPTVDIRC
jgi:hypothetical protein